MSVIVEVHTEQDVYRLMNLDMSQALIGINNRNLQTLKTDINTTYAIHDLLREKGFGPIKTNIKEQGRKFEKKTKTFNSKYSGVKKIEVELFPWEKLEYKNLLIKTLKL